MRKALLKWNIPVKRHHVGSIISHLMIPRNFRSTTKVTSSVYKTPTSSTSQMTKANCQAAGKHQSTMNQEQCHARLWRIWRNYTPTHSTDLAVWREPTTSGWTPQSSQQHMPEGRLLDRRGNHHGASWTNTMGLFSDIPEETKWRSKSMSGSKQLEQGHHQRAL